MRRARFSKKPRPLILKSLSDNGSTDGSVEYIRQQYGNRNVSVVDNRANLGFSRGNNAAIAAA
jgi:GT2 family glycosyltransferase